jgi:HAD superfamily hydrolase (TIGR01509 family)
MRNRAEAIKDIPQAVLFDWDGTLIDSGDILLTCWHEVTTRVLGAPFPITEEDRRKFLSMRGADSFPLLSDDPEVVRALDDGFTDAYLALAADHITPQEGSVELVKALRERGVLVAVVTSKTRLRMDRDMEICELVGAFDMVVTGDDVTRAKPDPEGVLAALAQLHATAERSVMVGDGPVDIKAGRAAGTMTVGISHGLHSGEELRDAEPDLLIESLLQLGSLWGLTSLPD